MNTSTNSITITDNYSSGSGVLTTTAIGASSWATSSSICSTESLVITAKGDATFHKDVEVRGDLTVGGVSVCEQLKRIEERLNILRPNADIEGRWEQLRELGDRYRALEAELLEREEILRILKE